MTVVLILATWWLLLALVASALFAAAGRADRIIESWDAERAHASAALDTLGGEADEMRA